MHLNVFAGGIKMDSLFFFHITARQFDIKLHLCRAHIELTR